MHQLVPEQVLEKAEKILFIIQGSITRFTYLYPYFVAFTKKYPSVKADLWVDETRRTRFFWKWEHLKKYGLYDWLNECSFFNKVYTQNYSVSLFKKSVEQAQAENYSVVVILTPNRPAFYIQLARSIAPQAFLAAAVKTPSWYQLKSKANIRKLNAILEVASHQDKEGYSYCYARWFRDLFDVSAEPDQQVIKNFIPRRWISFAKLRFMKWGFDKQSKKFGKVIFINPFAQKSGQSWSLKSVFEIMQSIKRSQFGSDIHFIVNTDVAHYHQARKFFDYYSINNIILFCATSNFLQIPALIEQCDLVVSIESSVIHLAAALAIPVIVLVGPKPRFLPENLNGGSVIHLKKDPVTFTIQTIQKLVINS